MSKLGIKLLIIILTIALGSLILVSIFINASINENFKEYLQSKNKNKVNLLIDYLQKNYKKNNSWENSIDEYIVDFIQKNNLKVLLKDRAGNQVYSNHRGMMKGHTPKKQEIERFNITNSGDKQIGTLLWLIPPRKNLFSQHEQLFTRHIQQAIYYTAGLIAIITIIITIFLSRYLTNPLLKINQAARKVAQGDFSKTVTIRGRDELSELGKAFNEMVNKLNQLQKARKESVSNFAHELRTPITNINNYLEAIEDGIIDTNSQTIAEIQEELQRLIKLTNNLKKLNDAESKIVNLQKENLNLIELIKTIAEKYKLQAQKKDITINQNYPEQKLFFKGDKESLQTIFNNLFSNAVKYTNNKGTITISVTKGENIIIKIINTGQKIAQKDLPYIFERFYRSNNTSSSQKEGSGIGLTITKKLVEVHNGKIKVDSNQNKTVFTIIFPSS